MPDNLPVRLVGRMAFVALVIGTSLAVSSTERIDLSVVLSTTTTWTFVPLLQLATGLILVRGVRGTTAALAAYFDTHVPWSMWIIVSHAVLLLAGPARDAALWMALTAVIPAFLTIRLLVVLCETQLGMSRRLALRRVAVHQTVSYALVLLYVAIAVALWPRLA